MKQNNIDVVRRWIRTALLLLILIVILGVLLWYRSGTLSRDTPNSTDSGEVFNDFLDTTGWQTYSGTFPSSGWSFSMKYPPTIVFSKVNDEIISAIYDSEMGGGGTTSLIIEGFLVTIRVEPMMTLENFLAQMNPSGPFTSVPFKEYDAVTYTTGIATGVDQVTHITFELHRDQNNMSVVDIAYSIAGEKVSEHERVLFTMLETLIFW